VRDFPQLIVFGIVEEEVDCYVEEMSIVLGIEVAKSKDAESVVQWSDIVLTTTPSKEPYLEARWLHPGLHITCMGSDSEDKQELHADVFGVAVRIVCDIKSQSFRLGELHHALDAGVITNEAGVFELGELTSGAVTGRESESEITVCDLTGVGVQDTQIARLAYQRAVERGLGLYVE